MLSVERTVILSHSPMEALEKLIMLRKSEKPSFNKSAISRRLGCSSRSYLTDILKGRKSISIRLVKPLITLLGLDEHESRYLEIQLLLTTSFASDDATRSGLEGERKQLRSLLTSNKVQFDEKIELNAIFLVYLTLYILPGKQGSYRSLYAKLTMLTAQQIQKSAHELIRQGLIQEQDSVLSICTEKEFSFLDSESSDDYEQDFLRSAIEESIEHLPMVKEKRQDVIFHSSLITAEKAQLHSLLETMRNELSALRAKVESKNANQLVRFNLQLYPLLEI
ncbi:MAG: TIGR02147 family protein [Pseudobacteriovorax sp.]|nr:TIGR02147 family protein [Pseudobacteriovorax sp.]